MASSNGHTRYFLVLPAAGSGSRMQAELPKQYLKLGNRSLLQHSLERLGMMPEVERVAIALAKDDSAWPGLAKVLPPALAGKLVLAEGGAERAQSVYNAMAALTPYAHADDWVLVHDAVRPCVHPADVRKLMAELSGEEAGGLLGTPVRETLKASADGRYVEHTVDRSRIWQAATPQMFRFAILQRALRQALSTNSVVTDEAAAVEALGMRVRLVGGRADNLKITYPGDLQLAGAVLEAQAREVVG